jgi:hypothetical protein
MKQAIKIIIVIHCLLLWSNFVLGQVEVQRGTPVTAECGGIIEGEFSTNAEEHNYTIQLSAGDTLDLSIEPLGGQLSTILFVSGPTNLGVVISMGSTNDPARYQYPELMAAPAVNTGQLSASGIYTIRITNFVFRFYRFAQDSYQDFLEAGGVGVYTLYVGCTLRDGTVIAPGDVLVTDSSGETEITNEDSGTAAQSNLTPITFPGAANIPLSSGVTAPGVMSPEGVPTYTYTFSAVAGDIFSLQVDRTSGNLNLGIVLLSPAGEIVFYGGLLINNSLPVAFNLPADGQYTIGIFRVDLIPPAAPEATTFQVLGTLNP